MIKNQLIKHYLEVDKIKHEPTRRDLLWKLQVQKEQLFKTASLDELRDFNERISPTLPRYGELYIWH